MSELTHERLLECLIYEPETGVFRYRIARHYLQRVGTVAGCDDGRGYLQLHIDGVKYWLHRLAWFYVHASWPEHVVDHVNGDPSDNRIANLRSASQSENLFNMRKPRDNHSGFKGVSWHAGARKWVAQICAKRTHHYLGLFDTREAAHAAYVAKSRELHGEFARIA